MNKNILLLALGDIYWTRFVLHLSKALEQAGLNPIIVLESRVGEYQAYLKRCDYGNTKVYYLSDYAASYQNQSAERSNANNVMCDYLRVMKHGHSKKLLNTNWNFVSKCIDDFTAHVFENVVGRLPTHDESVLLTTLLDDNTFTKSSFLEMAAQTDLADTVLQNMTIDIIGIPYDIYPL
mgnify:CR=1 FL=1